MPEPRTISDAAGFIRNGELTPVELLEQCLSRIDQYEDRVRAWAYLDRDRARDEAGRLTEELKRGEYRGPLHGIPVGVKDIIDVFDTPTGCGSRLWANSYARRDATVVERLRQAGAVIVGKTVTTAFASFDPPVTRNPWNLDRTPGGSSSGSAAAVACGMCLGALATQTGGSITRPASYCGVCSLKPTYGRVSVDGVLPLAPSMDHVGVMANCVRDLAILFQVIAGPDERDPESRDVTVPDVLTVMDRRQQGPPEGVPFFIARLGGMFREMAEPIVWDFLNDAFSDLLTAYPDRFSHELAVPPAGFADVLKWHRWIMAVEAAKYHRDRLCHHPDDYPPRVRSLIEEGLVCPAVDYRDARLQRDKLEEVIHISLFRAKGAKVFLTPATTGPAPPAETTGDPALNSPWSFLGLPTISVPVEWYPGEYGDLPISAQLIGARMGETDLLNAAAWLEAAAGFVRRPLPL
jgi:Asp-tRNA(Asn)/Glu-tRNA(Gln) amidotransferase A subunit family amidase